MRRSPAAEPPRPSTRAFVVAPGDAHPSEAERVPDAQQRLRAAEVVDPDSAAFAEAYDTLDAYFGPKNELEARPALQQWLRAPIDDGAVRARYHLLTWTDAATGRLAAVRDCFVATDIEVGRTVVLLSHSFVLPEWRRGGASTLLRTAPATLARRDQLERGLDPARTPTLLVGEMEPANPADPDTLVRMVAYGRVGYRAVPAAAVPYFQPDFRDVAALGVAPRHVPLCLMVRRIDQPDAPHLDKPLAGAIVRHLARVQARAVAPHVVDEAAGWSLAALDRWPTDVPLLPLPAHPDDAARLEPLLRARVLPHYPPDYHEPGAT